MSEESVRPLNPLPEEFSGQSMGRRIKRLFHATRPKFFPASVLPVVAGTAYGAAVAGPLDLYIAILALLATMCVHAAANVINDVGDAEGTDPINEDRIYPYTGGSRFIQTGILTQSTMGRLGIALIVIASLLGLLLIVEKGVGVLIFGIAGIVLTVLYSVGPAKLSGLGLGELAVAVGLGVLPVAGAAWLQGAAIDTALVLFSIPVSIWVAAILFINEVPDMAADQASGKNTLPVRMGLKRSAALYIAAHVAAAAITVYLTIGGHLPLLAPVVPVLLLVLAAKAAAAIRVGVANREQMTAGIEATLGIHTIGCIWLAGCMVYAIVF